MSRTREEFIRRWRCHIAGMALFGVASETKDGPLARAGRILDIPAEVEKLLGLMYDDLARDTQPLPTGNGKPVKVNP